MVGQHHCLNGHDFEQTQGDSEGDREAWHAAAHGVSKSQTQLSDRTTMTHINIPNKFLISMHELFNGGKIAFSNNGTATIVHSYAHSKLNSI